MKRVILMSILFAITLHTRGQKDSITFLNESILELINNTQDFDKLIFIDMTATWCKPCQEMEKTTFQDKDVADYFSSNFLCKKIYIDFDSIQNDSISRLLRNQTPAVPQYYFLDKNGKVLMKSGGYKTPSDLINLGKVAKDKVSPEYEIAQMEKSYTKNKTKQAFLLKYMQLKNNIGQKGDIALDDYLKLIPVDKYTNDTILYTIINNEKSIYGKGYQILTDENYQQQATIKAAVNGNISIGYDMYKTALDIIMQNIGLAISNKNENLVKDGITELNKVMQNKEKAKELSVRVMTEFNKQKSTANPLE
ncbi:thioredoxin family protein [Plebeiibacterium sediminum]|uniref:Thioredoxin family protein n=1 Tax=Plebeiibacterium sediminum TaxID=2992112 RepID=A0AAE3M7P2_9BACT|nr:thioredoxin fold domain-containing protein [Plebeiobacterium sediminum]MCW3788334.1 thioredoxin family protein [Plebeiobacterium sediminum]